MQLSSTPEYPSADAMPGAAYLPRTAEHQRLVGDGDGFPACGTAQEIQSLIGTQVPTTYNPDLAAHGSD